MTTQYGSPNNRIRTEWPKQSEFGSAFRYEKQTNKIYAARDGAYSVNGNIVNAKKGDLLAENVPDDLAFFGVQP